MGDGEGLYSTGFALRTVFVLCLHADERTAISVTPSPAPASRLLTPQPRDEMRLDGTSARVRLPSANGGASKFHAQPL